MQLTDLFYLYLVTGIFLPVLKTAKVLPVFKKDSKLDYSNYRPISLLSIIEKILEKLMKDCALLSVTITVHKTYNLVSDNVILHHLSSLI